MWRTLKYPKIEEYASNFLISDLGEIKNIKTDHIYKPEILSSGYYSVKVSLGSRHNKKHIIIHKAVALTFIDNPNNYNMVNHIDGNKLNNNVNNLEWCTPGHNVKHAYDTGLFDKHKISGENNHNHKLTKKQVDEIRALYNSKDKHITSSMLAKKFGVSKTQILDIINYKKWNNM